MKQSLATLMALGLFSGAAMAQTQIQIYGVADIGVIKESGSNARMGSFSIPRIGLDGSEDLGGGMKATFELQQRFLMNDGIVPGNFNWDNSMRQEKLGDKSKADWNAMANVGIKGHWGHVRVGRVPDMATETFSRTDPFEQNAIVSSFTNNNYLHTVFLSNSVRYDTPVFSDTKFGVTYTLGSDDHGNTEAARFARQYGNNGYAFNALFDNGQLALLANFERLADSNNSFLWNTGGTVKLGAWQFYLGYEQSTFKSMEGYMVRGNQKEWLAAIRYRTGPHVLTATVNRGELNGTAHDGHADKLAAGYGYNLSKRTQLYANVVYISSSNEFIGSVYNSNRAATDSMTGVQFGITHLF